MHYTAPAELVEMFSVFVSPDIEDEKIDLIRASLVIARTEYPKLEIEEYVGRVESLARRVAAEASDFDRVALASLNRILFQELKLRGNREDYYNPPETRFKTMRSLRLLAFLIAALHPLYGSRAKGRISAVRGRHKRS